MTSTEALICDLADSAELTEHVAGHSLWVDEGFADTDRLFTEAVAAAIHRYRARRTTDGWRFDRLEVQPVALTDALARAL
ncbi:hypothetical protein [Nocardia gipuzkoensis]